VTVRGPALFFFELPLALNGAGEKTQKLARAVEMNRFSGTNVFYPALERVGWITFGRKFYNESAMHRLWNQSKMNRSGNRKDTVKKLFRFPAQGLHTC